MAHYKMTTLNGYVLLEVRSALQKEIRRANTKMAGYWAVELSKSGFYNYVWKTLLIISAEDCDGVITQEIESLMRAYLLVNKGKKGTDMIGHVFVAKAAILLAAGPKSRDADHLCALVHRRKLTVTEEDLSESLADSHGEELFDIPEHALDAHTAAGRKKGKTKEQFFVDEFVALHPRQAGLFDDLPQLFVSSGGDSGSEQPKSRKNRLTRAKPEAVQQDLLTLPQPRKRTRSK